MTVAAVIIQGAPDNQLWHIGREYHLWAEEFNRRFQPLGWPEPADHESFLNPWWYLRENLYGEGVYGLLSINLDKRGTGSWSADYTPLRQGHDEILLIAEIHGERYPTRVFTYNVP